MVKLELNGEQAFLLRAILDRVAYIRKGKRGKEIDEIIICLVDQGVEYSDDMPYMYYHNNTLIIDESN